MQRDVLERFFEWNDSKHRKPLVLMGARQGALWRRLCFDGRVEHREHVENVSGLDIYRRVQK